MKVKPKPGRSHAAMVLLSVVGFMVIVSSIAGSYIFRRRMDMELAANRFDKVYAFNFAESGVDDCYQYWYNASNSLRRFGDYLTRYRSYIYPLGYNMFPGQPPGTRRYMESTPEDFPDKITLVGESTFGKADEHHARTQDVVYPFGYPFRCERIYIDKYPGKKITIEGDPIYYSKYEYNRGGICTIKGKEIKVNESYLIQRTRPVVDFGQYRRIAARIINPYNKYFVTISNGNIYWLERGMRFYYNPSTRRWYYYYAYQTKTEPLQNCIYYINADVDIKGSVTFRGVIVSTGKICVYNGGNIKLDGLNYDHSRQYPALISNSDIALGYGSGGGSIDIKGILSAPRIIIGRGRINVSGSIITNYAYIGYRPDLYRYIYSRSYYYSYMRVYADSAGRLDLKVNDKDLVYQPPFFRYNVTSGQDACYLSQDEWQTGLD